MPTTRRKSLTIAVLNYPLTKGNFEYSYNQRLNATSNPYFEADGIAYDGAIPTYLKEGVATLPGISFPAAKDDDLVQHYEVRLVDEAAISISILIFLISIRARRVCLKR